MILSFRPDEYTIETVENYFDIKLEKNKIFNTNFFINNSFENKIEALKSFDKCVNILKKCLKKKQPYADYIQRPEVENELKHFSILYKIKENIIVCSISIVKDSVANLPPKWSVEISFSKLIKTG